jgi:hypothetical protein
VWRVKRLTPSSEFVAADRDAFLANKGNGLATLIDNWFGAQW